VTRGQLMAMLDRASSELLAPMPPASGPRFEDTAGSVHQPAIDRMNAAGIAMGLDDGSRFGPSESVIRGQTASFITRWLEWQHDALS
jgi:hypothetical protein